ncbi:hypothetical protein LP419_26625 [Massilia sp. H-1]|nr:hypothetical protein LP419_26625 [Massilia sp. H-1]
MRMPLIKPELGRAPAVAPATLKRWLDQGHDDHGKPVVMVDTRNAFEVDVGTFDNTIDYRIDKFTEFPEVIAANKDALNDKTVVTFCTGGIRCEKAAIHMQNIGYQSVYQLGRRHSQVLRRRGRRPLHGRLLRVRLPHRAQSEARGGHHHPVLRVPRRGHPARTAFAPVRLRRVLPALLPGASGPGHQPGSHLRMGPAFCWCGWSSRWYSCTVGFLLRRPRLKRMALALLDRMPRVQARLYAVVRQPDTVAPRRRHVPQTAADLSPLAARHYQALEASVRGRQTLMRIVIDLQGAQTASRFRGIGRYTSALARGMLRHA